MAFRLRPRVLAAAATLAGSVLLLSSVASAHSLESSTVSVVVGEDSADATISVALETLDEVLGTDYAAGSDVASYADEVITYLDEHLTDAAGEISTAGVLDASDSNLQIGATADIGIADMIGYGFHHVLEGADHLLFRVTLLLVAPLVAVAGRWRRADGVLPTARKVVGVVTAFTAGHSLTLIASALGWVSLPSTPVEVLIAASVGVAAVHVMRPLARHGEEAIAGLFGLVHGLAFAGILTDLGLDGSTSLLALLAFNLGVELAQLVTVVLLFPSLYLLSRTRSYRSVRLAGASIALAAAGGWAMDRLGVLGNPLAGVEDWVISHPWNVVVALALLAGCCWLIDRRGVRSLRRAVGAASDESPQLGATAVAAAGNIGTRRRVHPSVLERKEGTR